MSLAKEIEELQRKAGSYDLLKEDYDNLKARIKEAIRGLQGIAEIQVERKIRNKDTIPMAQIMEELYDKMKYQDGFMVNGEVLEKSYPNIEFKNSSISNIIYRLSKFNNIVKIKKNGRTSLFYQKTTDKAEQLKIGKVSLMG